MPTMCRRLLETLLTLSGTGSCFPRPGRPLADSSSSRDGSQTNILPSHQTNHSQTHAPDTNVLTRRSSSSSTSSSSSNTTPRSSLVSLPSALRASLNRRISSWRSDRSDQWPQHSTESGATAPETATTTTTSESDNEDFIASLDALALSEHEREVLGRMQLVVQSARVARERRVGRQDWGDLDGVSDVEPSLHLRGGGNDVLPFRTPRRRTTLPVDDPVLPRPDSARPPRGLWWLAGGGKGKVPTLGELRVRKEVERANRKVVGFCGTVLGVRRVGRVGILDNEGVSGADNVDGDDGGSGAGVEGADAGSSHGSKSIGSFAGAGAGGGSSASSHRERELEVDQPVEAKVESVASVASAGDNQENSKANSLNVPAEDHASTKAGSIPVAASRSQRRDRRARRALLTIMSLQNPETERTLALALKSHMRDQRARKALLEVMSQRRPEA